MIPVFMQLANRQTRHESRGCHQLHQACAAA